MGTGENCISLTMFSRVGSSEVPATTRNAKLSEGIAHEYDND